MQPIEVDVPGDFRLKYKILPEQVLGRGRSGLVCAARLRKSGTLYVFRIVLRTRLYSLKSECVYLKRAIAYFIKLSRRMAHSYWEVSKI
jgi:hypothetical protein